jgi:hypothetical protein
LDGDKQGIYILSNSHVLANEGVAEKGDVIVQPGVFDDGKAPGDVIAKLADWVPFEYAVHRWRRQRFGGVEHEGKDCGIAFRRFTFDKHLQQNPTRH